MAQPETQYAAERRPEHRVPGDRRRRVRPRLRPRFHLPSGHGLGRPVFAEMLDATRAVRPRRSSSTSGGPVCRIASLGFGTAEDRMDDIRAVMDAAGSERAALVGVSEGGPLAILFAATYPERIDRDGPLVDVRPDPRRRRLRHRCRTGARRPADHHGVRAVGTGQGLAVLHREHGDGCRHEAEARRATSGVRAPRRESATSCGPTPSSTSGPRCRRSRHRRW